jgi:hypothetical protein
MTMPSSGWVGEKWRYEQPDASDLVAEGIGRIMSNPTSYAAQRLSAALAAGAYSPEVLQILQQFDYPPWSGRMEDARTL